jgi:hypothetical protein
LTVPRLGVLGGRGWGQIRSAFRSQVGPVQVGTPTGSHVTTLAPTDADFCAQYGTSRPVDMGTVQIVTRVYQEPATGTRPALSELLLDRALLFTPK